MSAPRPRPRPRPTVPPASNVIELRPGFSLPEPPAEPEPAPPRTLKGARSRPAKRLGRPPKHLQRSATPAKDLQSTATATFGEKASGTKDLQCATQPIHVSASAVARGATANALLPKREFLKLVHELSAMKLRERFRSEAVAHRAMMQRRAAGYVIDPEFQEFRSFLVHVGQRPNASWTLDRRDPANPLYGPGLVRWADPRQQANNRQKTRYLDVDGEIRPASDWARATGQKASTIRTRLARGCDHEEAVYGRKRGVPAEPAPAPLPVRPPPPTDAWPAGATAAYWDGPWQAFAVKAKPHLNFRISRALFFAWIGTNKLRVANATLKRDFPSYNDPEGDPEDAPDVSRHPSAAVIDAYTLKTGEAMTALMSDFTAMEALRYLCRRFPNVYSPEEAPKLNLREDEDDY